jgi:hypothetical protein
VAELLLDRAGSSSSIEGRTQSIEASPSAGSSSASADDGRVATATAPAAGSGAAPSPVQNVRLIGAALIAGAGGASRMLGTAGSPDAGLIGTATAAFVAAAFAAGFASVVGGRLSASAAVVFDQAPAVTNGRMIWSRCRLNASISPTTTIASRTTMAPGAVRSGSSRPSKKRPIRPPAANVELPTRICPMPRTPAYIRPMPSSVSPQPLGRRHSR